MRPEAVRGKPTRRCGAAGSRKSVAASAPAAPCRFLSEPLSRRGMGAAAGAQLLYLERLWFGIERGADEAARVPELPPSFNVFSLQRVLLSALFSFLISSPAAM